MQTDLMFIFQRGREHGVGTYLAVRRWCQQHPIFKSLYDGPVEMLQVSTKLPINK